MLVVVGLVPAVLAWPVQGASAAEVTPAHHTHHKHHARAAHHPLHPKATLQRPVPAVPLPLQHPPEPPPVPASVGTRSGLPLPRFASLHADDVNMRSGPGSQYPILWLYKRRDLPVEIERQFDLWRLVSDADGVKGWVHQATLSGSRSFIVTATGSIAGAGVPGLGSTDHGVGTLLRDDPRDDAGIIAILRPGVIGRIRVCPAGSDWCRVSTQGYSGWLLRSSIFGLLPNEAITHP